MVQGNDGGATVSYNGGESWSTILNQPTAQLYHVAADNHVPYRVYASQQDNTSISLPSRSDYGKITLEDWYTVGGGEDGYIAPHPTNANVVYAGDHHWIYRYDHKTKQIRDISPNPETHYGWGSADINYRFWWTYPVAVSPHDPNVLYVTSQYVHKSTNQGESWETISPDLSRADPKTLRRPRRTSTETGPYWGPITAGLAPSGTRRSSRSRNRRRKRESSGRGPTTATSRSPRTEARAGRTGPLRICPSSLSSASSTPLLTTRPPPMSPRPGTSSPTTLPTFIKHATTDRAGSGSPTESRRRTSPG
jgi:hypothetical protein